MARLTEGRKKTAFARVSITGLACFAAAVLTFAPAAARADDQAPPVCPSGYVWDQASGRCVAREGSYPTPLQQTTQSTYVPQSVAMSGPRVIKDWQEGDPIPDGYRVTLRARVGLVVGGSVLFGVMYFFSVLGAAVVHDANSGTSGDNADALFIPGIGPFMQMTKTTSTTGNVFNALDGLAQCGGLAMLIVGMTSPRHVLVRNDLAKPFVLPTPYIGQGGGGLGLVGRF